MRKLNIATIAWTSLALACGGGAKKGDDGGSDDGGGVAKQPVTTTTGPTIAPLSKPAFTNSAANTLTFPIKGACSNGSEVTLGGDFDEQSQTCTDSQFEFTVTVPTDGAYNALITAELEGEDTGTFTQLYAIDTTAPAAPELIQPSSTSFLSGDGSLTIVVGCEVGATVSLSGDGSTSAACDEVNQVATLNQSKASAGVYTYSIKQTDFAGNASESTALTWTFDNSVPATPDLSSPPTTNIAENTGSLSINGTCTTGNSVNLTGDVTSGEAGGSLSKACSGGGFNFTINKASQGSYTILVSQHKDATGITSAEVAVVWNYDADAPAALSPTSPNPTIDPFTSPGPLAITGPCENGATVSVSGDASTSTPCTNNQFSLSVDESSDGSYSYNLTQSDPAGNTSPSFAINWSRDSSAITVPIVLSPSGGYLSNNADTLAISGECVAGLTVVLEEQGELGESTTPCSNGVYSFIVDKSSASSASTYTFRLHSTDGTVDSQTNTVVWQRDVAGPSASFTVQPADPSASLRPIFEFTSGESTASFDCRLDSGAWTSCTSPHIISGVTSGSHTFQVRARDTFENVGPVASHTWSATPHKTVALYKFEPGGVDSSSYNGTSFDNSMTITGTAPDPAGKFNNGRKLEEGNTDNLRTAANESHNALRDQMTLEAWIKLPVDAFNDTGEIYTLISKAGYEFDDSTLSDYGFSFSILRQGGSSDRRLAFTASEDGNNTDTVLSGDLTLVTDVWYHASMTWERGAVKFFLDGTLVGSGNIGTPGKALISETEAALRIGIDDGFSNYADLSFDDVRISQVVRYTSSFTKPSASFSAD